MKNEQISGISPLFLFALLFLLNKSLQLFILINSSPGELVIQSSTGFGGQLLRVERQSQQFVVRLALLFFREVLDFHATMLAPLVHTSNKLAVVGDKSRLHSSSGVRMAMEAGTHSIWISEQLQLLGLEVIVANVRELRTMSHSDRKSDQVDAEKLARFARLDSKILRPIAHRTLQQQQALTLIRARPFLANFRITDHPEIVLSRPASQS